MDRASGHPGRAQQVAQTIRARAASFLWARWNRIAHWDWLAKRLNLRLHEPDGPSGSVSVAQPPLRFDFTGTVSWGSPPADGTTEERLAWLEACMTDADGQLRRMYLWHWQEVRERQDVADRERNEREAEDQRVRDSIAGLAGGGLTLQTWGVVCLLAGTIMTAIW